MAVSRRTQYQASGMGLEHDNPMIFITSQWQYDKDRPSITYLVVRLAIFITFLTIWILTIVLASTANRQKWPIYLTNWGLTLCLLQSFVLCVLLMGAHADSQHHWKNTINRLYSTYWLLHILATTVAFSITLIYWSLIYSAEGAYWSTMNFMVHAFNSILMLVDFWVVSHPVQLLHCCYPVAIALTYTMMTVIFYILGGTTADGSKYIYPILKWDEPLATLGYCLAVVVIMIIIHMLTYLMFKIRIFFSMIHKKCVRCCDRYCCCCC